MPKKTKTKKNQKKWLQVLQFFAAYLVAAWTFLQFVDWILIRYSISPYWVEVFLWLFVGIIPSLIIYLYHRERINSRILHLREKIIFPLNIGIIAIGLYFGFGTSDLGATTKEIDITNSVGETERITITKEEFRTILPIFNFTPISKDSSLIWLDRGIPTMLYYDLSQDKSLTVERNSADNTTDKVAEAKVFSTIYVDGSFDKQDDTYMINVAIRSSNNGKVISDKTFSGTDLLNMIDELSVYIKEETVVSLEKSYFYLDLDTKEFMSPSLPAIQNFVEGDFEKAIEIDSTFSMAYLRWLTIKLHYNQGRADAKMLADNAYRHKSKLPYDLQKEVQLYRFLAYEEWEAAENLAKMQLEISPQNSHLNLVLYRIYGATKNTMALYKHAEEQYKKVKSPFNTFMFTDALLINGEYDRYIKEVKYFMRLSPFNDHVFPYLLKAQILKGDFKDAQATLDKIHLLFPNKKNENKVFDTAMAYLGKNKKIIQNPYFFEGEYRGQHSEIIGRFWVEDNRVLSYFSNQIMVPMIIGGPTKLIRGKPNSETIEYDYILNEVNEPYLIKVEQNNGDNSRIFWIWKLDAVIKKAEAFLHERNYDEAEAAYKKAIAANPKHFNLKDALQHIQYVKNTDSLTLQKQYEGVVGTYSKEDVATTRKFWIKDGRLIYKREGLSSKELLPISETRYMNMSEFQYNYEFEYKDGQAFASFTWFFDPEKMAWEKFHPETNHLLKDRTQK